MATENPISVGYRAIFSALNAWPAFNPGLVKSGLGTQQDALAKGFSPQTNAQAGDRPAIRLLEGRIMGQPYQVNSKAVGITVSYPMQILSDVLGINKINLLDTVVLQALMNADGPGNPGTLGVPGTIYKWEIQPSNIQQKDPLTKRPGWTTTLTLLLAFRIIRSEFLANTYT